MSEYIDLVKSEKSKLKIVIFGPYKKEGYDRLVQLKEYLHSHGHTKSDLVAHLPDPPNSARQPENVFNITKSEYWVRSADVSLYIFFKDISHGSVAIEMKELYDNAFHRVSCASFFVQTGENLDGLEWGLIERLEKNIGHFDYDSDLFVLAEKACLYHLVEDDCIQNI